MFFSIAEAFWFAAELECRLRDLIGDEGSRSTPREADDLVSCFAKYAKTKFAIYDLDFSSTDGADPEFAAESPFRDLDADFCSIDDRVTEVSLLSLLFFYRKQIRDLDADDGVSDILLHARGLNRCWMRFCLTKEAAHVPIRVKGNSVAGEAKRSFSAVTGRPLAAAEDGLLVEKEYMEHGPGMSFSVMENPLYPDSKTDAQVADLLHGNVARKFSIDDFDNPNYPNDQRAENSAEILAILLLFPPCRMIEERNRLLEELGGAAGDLTSLRWADFLPVATRWRIPKRYVELFLSWPKLEYYADIYEAGLRETCRRNCLEEPKTSEAASL